MIDVQFGLNIRNIPDLVRREICGIFEKKDLTEEQRKNYIKSEYQITKKPTDNRKYKYARSDIMEKNIRNCSGVKKCNNGINRTEKENQRDNFRILLGFKENEIYERKEYSITKRIKKIFKKQTIIKQYKVKNYFIDLVFPEHKLGIEIDENGHIDRSEIKEQKRSKTIKKETGFKIIRINPDKENFDINDEIGEIQDFIYEFGKKIAEESTRKSLIED